MFFCFDGDAAGRKAAWRALESVLPRMRDGRQANFLFLPEGEDPDSLVRAEGAGGFDRHLAQAVPLSEYFFAELARDIRLDTLDGRARLAERCKEPISKIPDGAFRDLMQQRVAELTGVHSGTRLAAVPQKRPVQGSPTTPRRSLVRSAIALLLHNPALGLAIVPPYPFAALRQPGVGLLIELLELIREHPHLRTGQIVEHFEGREEAAALTKLSMQELPGGPDIQQQELLDALTQMEQQARQQRIEELRTGGDLGEAEKAELRELLAARGAAHKSAAPRSG